MRNNITQQDLLLQESGVVALMEEAKLPEMKETIDKLSKGMELLQSE